MIPLSAKFGTLIIRRTSLLLDVDHTAQDVLVAVEHFWPTLAIVKIGQVSNQPNKIPQSN